MLLADDEIVAFLPTNAQEATHGMIKAMEATKLSAYSRTMFKSIRQFAGVLGDREVLESAVLPKAREASWRVPSPEGRIVHKFKISRAFAIHL